MLMKEFDIFMCDSKLRLNCRQSSERKITTSTEKLIICNVGNLNYVHVKIYN